MRLAGSRSIGKRVLWALAGALSGSKATKELQDARSESAALAAVQEKDGSRSMMHEFVGLVWSPAQDAQVRCI